MHVCYIPHAIYSHCREYFDREFVSRHGDDASERLKCSKRGFMLVAASPKCLKHAIPARGSNALCNPLVQISSVNALVLDSDLKPTATGKSKTTWGWCFGTPPTSPWKIWLQGSGGAAYSCQQIHRLDILTSINGQSVIEGDSAGKRITGSNLGQLRESKLQKADRGCVLSRSFKDSPRAGGSLAQSL